MDTRTIPTASNVSLVTTTPRVTPTPPRAAKFGEVLANTAVRSAETAMNSLPGGPMMALAVRGGAASVPLTSTAASVASTAPAGPVAAGSSSTGSSLGSALGSTVGADGGASDANTALQQGQDQAMQMLTLQQQVQNQNQYFSTVSNVMKAQHDTVKTAIGNIH